MDSLVRFFLDLKDFFIVIQRDAEVLHLLLEGVNDFSVDEFQQPRPFIDEGDGDSQRGENGGVLRADHAASDDDDGIGNMLQRQEPVCVDDRVVLERNVRRTSRLRPHRDDDEVRRQFQLAVIPLECADDEDRENRPRRKTCRRGCEPSDFGRSWISFLMT